MSEPFIAEIRIFAGNFAPRNWAFCNGQLMPIAQNTGPVLAGRHNLWRRRSHHLGLPNLQGRAPMHPGRGPGLRQHQLGEQGGSETAALNENQLPRHEHPLRAAGNADRADPGGNALGAAAMYGPAGGEVAMAAEAIGHSGGNQAHNNMQPYLAINFVIALQGLFPSRS